MTLMLIWGFLIVLLVAVAFLFWFQFKNKQQAAADPQVANRRRLPEAHRSLVAGRGGEITVRARAGRCRGLEPGNVATRAESASGTEALGLTPEQARELIQRLLAAASTL